MKVKELFGKIKQLFKGLSNNWKTHYRFTVKTEENHEEKFSFVLTPQRIVAVVGSSVVGLIALTALIISVTPLKYYIPGYTTREEHELYLQVAGQVDSLELLLSQNQQYLDNFVMLLSGEIMDDENHLSSEETSENQGVQERDEHQKEAMKEISEEANLLLSENVRSEEDNSKIPVSHRADISNIVLYPPTTGAIIKEFNLASNTFGIDIRNAKNTLITSVADGIVIYAGFDPTSGNTLIIQHPGGIITIYSHNDLLLKSVGAKVKMGEPVAKMGNSGKDTFKNPHLHFELWYNGFPVNPLDYIVMN